MRLGRAVVYRKPELDEIFYEVDLRLGYPKEAEGTFGRFHVRAAGRSKSTMKQIELVMLAIDAKTGDIDCSGRRRPRGCKRNVYRSGPDRRNIGPMEVSRRSASHRRHWGLSALVGQRNRAPAN